MFTSELFRTVATLACTVVFSATAVVAAVGPGHTPNTAPNTVVAATQRLTA
jgi:hypothetical protein